MVDKLLEWLKSLPKKFIDWWEHFTSRQKIALVCLAVGVITAFIILIVNLTKPQYISIYKAETPAEAQSALDLLAGADGMDYHTSEDGLEIFINKKNYTDANLLLGSNNIYTSAFTIDNVSEGGFSSTEADRNRRYIVYLEGMMEDTLETYTFVKEAQVQLNVPEDNGTLISQKKETSASVMLTLSDQCTRDASAAMARFIATALGNDSTEHVVIVDNQGNLLYSGSSESSAFGIASSQMALQEQYTDIIENNVRRIFLDTNSFSDVQVAANIVLDNSYTEKSSHTYNAPDGKEEGMLASRDTYNAQNSGGVSGIPGTDSQVETGYEYENQEYSNSLVSETSEDFLPDEYTTYQEIPAGAILYNQSSIAAVCINYKVLHEEDAKSQGLLDGDITWEQYKLNNNQRVRVETDEELYNLVSNATGINTSDISIIVYEEPFFVDKEGIDVETADILQIILILLILGLLAFVVLRSMRSVKAEEEEPEISIDDILKSTPVENLEEISPEEKSESRRIVEKFVEDNPEAAANLLRNWLSEDWG
ncbi:MAG: flagellar M-ring protein FliF [Lachnospiraceae bacterium]|nr:flagellar M-ring protein FliF [Lachnospiraceae bacterium]